MENFVNGAVQEWSENEMILDILEYLFIAIFIVIMGFYLLIALSVLMIQCTMFHVKQRKEKKNGQFKNSNNFKTNDTEHNQFEESEEHNFKLQ